MRKVRRAAVDVDVDAVRRTGNERHVGAEAAEEVWSNRGRGAMRTVDDNASPGEFGAHDLQHPFGVGLSRAVQRLRDADVLSGRKDGRRVQ